MVKALITCGIASLMFITVAALAFVEVGVE
jgi:hypothetical protein